MIPNKPLGAAQASRLAAGTTSAQLIVAVPFYRGERLVSRLVGSLIDCSEEIRALGAHVVLFNDSPDYPPLDKALAEAKAAVGDAFDVTLERNSQNLGWLKTVNLAMQMAVDSGADLLILNSDTVVFPGAFTEMVRVARADPMIGFVNPRSNNATLANLPVGDRFATMSPKAAEAACRSIAGLLPEITYVPTAVGFAMLIRRNILIDFGFFDEIYGPGYNEENDLIMRASRCGYRAVLANRAFVWHEGEQSLGQSLSNKPAVEEANRQTLVKRYPEYPELIARWFDGVEHTAESLLSALIPDEKGRLSVAFDFSTFGPYYSGTQKAGVQLAEAAMSWSDRWDVFVLCAEDTFLFHGMDKLGLERRDPHGPERFAVVFRVGQPFDWDPARRLALKGAVTGVFMLDTIALDCGHLYSPFQYDIWQHVIQYSDFIVYNSAFTAQQFQRRFAHTDKPRSIVSLHSLDFADYRPRRSCSGPVPEDLAELGSDYVLVMGNQYPHKAVAETANCIARAYPGLKVVALGVTKKRSTMHGAPKGARAPLAPAGWLEDLPNLHGMEVGRLPDTHIDTLQRNARLIVMPSHYEGFGMPIPAALAYGKPVLARPLPPLLEIHAALACNPNIHFFRSTAELLELLESPPAWRDMPALPAIAGDGRRVADDLRRVMEQCVRDATYSAIRERFGAMHTIYGAAHLINLPPPMAPADAAARLIGDKFTRVFARLFRSKPFYKSAQFVYRLARGFPSRSGTREE